MWPQQVGNPSCHWMELHDHPAVFCAGASVFSAMAALLLPVDLLSAIACRILVGHRKSLTYQFAWPLPNGKPRTRTACCHTAPAAPTQFDSVSGGFCARAPQPSGEPANKKVGKKPTRQKIITRGGEWQVGRLTISTAAGALAS